MERQFPKNVKQIGNVCDEPKIYLEDYVDTYLNQLREKAAEEALGIVLLGEILKQEEHDVVYVSGALLMKGIEVKGTEIVIAEESWEQLEKEREEFFPEAKNVGWCLVEAGRPMGLNRGVSKVHSKFFAEDNSIFIWKDTEDTEDVFYAYKYEELMQMGGHYIYYEKNPFMQNYMINSRKMIGVTPSEMVEDRAAKDFRNTVREKMQVREQRQNSRFVYAMSVMLVVVVLAIGISTVNNFDKMEAVQESLESLSQSVKQPESQTAAVSEAELSGEEQDGEQSGEQGEAVQQESQKEEAAKVSAEPVEPQESVNAEDYYVVRRGDTLDRISIRLYGSTKNVDAICRMNGLSDGNLIFIGQKLLLP